MTGLERENVKSRLLAIHGGKPFMDAICLKSCMRRRAFVTGRDAMMAAPWRENTYNSGFPLAPSRRTERRGGAIEIHIEGLSSMYAVIKTGGKQYRVAAGEKLKVEQIPADIGATITFDQVLAVGSGADLVIGAPLVAGAKVAATVVAQGLGDKVRIFKLRRRKHYRKSQGHRQPFTEVQFSAIFGADGKELARAEAAAK